MDRTFEDATKATEELFDAEQTSLFDENVAGTAEQEPSEETPAEEVPAEEVPAEEVPAEETQPEETAQTQQVLADAVQTAEVAAQAAQEKDMQLNQVIQEMQGMREENRQLREAVSELSAQNEHNIVEDMMEMPVLDVNALAFADEETARAAQAEYAQKMAEYSKSQVMKELSPFVEQAKEGARIKERDEIIAAYEQNVPEMKGITELVPQMEHILSKNPAIASLPAEQRYVTAFMIAKGANSINSPAPEPTDPTADELMEFYNKNPEFQEMLEKKRLEEIKGSNSQQVPPFSASSGAVNAALNIKDKPKTFEEASERTRKMFGA